MKNKMKAAAASIIFCIIFVFCFVKCVELLENKSARVQYEAFFESETNFDVIFLGTSHMYNTILPQELWNEFGITSYNWGYSNCTTAENYYILQEVLKYTDPKLIVLDMYGLLAYENYGNGKYRTDRIEQQHVQFDSIPFSLNKYRASQDVFDDYSGNLDFMFNFIMYHNRWTELGEGDFTVTPSTQKGASFNVGLQQDAEFERLETDEKMEIDTVCYQYFLQILEYCSENEIQLLCVYLPYTASAKEQMVSNSIGEIIEAYDFCDYVNLLYSDILNLKTDIYDSGHVNYLGASKVTSWLGDYVLENYNLSGHADEEAYSGQWNTEYEEYVQYKMRTISAEKELYNKLLLIYGDEFEADLKILDGCNAEKEDEILSELIAELSDRISVEYVEELSLEDKKYDILLTIKRGDEIFDVAGYEYQNTQTIEYSY